MGLSIAPETLVTFLLVSTRMVATLTVAPPFNGGLVPTRIRAGIAVAIGIAMAGGDTAADVSLEFGSIFFAIVAQVVVGLTFGFMIQLLMASFQVAGSIIDLSAGLTAGALYDPITQSQSAAVGRMYQLVSFALLVAIDGHLLIIQGVMRSFEVNPTGELRIDALGTALSDGVGQLLIAALEVGFPVLAALMLTEVALAIASRAAPRMNIMAVGFGVKSLVTFVTLGLGLPLLANATTNLLESGIRNGAGLVGG